MRAFEIASRLAGLGEYEEAIKAYTIALDKEECTPEEQMEAALYILQHEGDYRISYTCFLNLYQQGLFQEDILSILFSAFYEPNLNEMRSLYARNCKLLAQYPYIFRKDFPQFHELPIQFFPFDDRGGYVPFTVQGERFGKYVNVRTPVVTRYFFKDLDNPILADDVFSQYELEYLVDSVRPSEYIARENHIYLHYTDWNTFCSWLQILNIRPLLEKKKVVFLIEDEIEQYPIDFKERFGIDYSRYKLRPVGVREVQRMIWHTQLSSHNGGDFFNEIFDNHPNLLIVPSILLSDVERVLKNGRKKMRRAANIKQAQEIFSTWKNPRMVEEVYYLRDLTEKDLFVAMYMGLSERTRHLDPASRLAPVLFFQPHFHNLRYFLEIDQKGRSILDSDEMEKLRKLPIFRQFKYIKTFTPMRRITTSYAAETKYAWNNVLNDWKKEKKKGEKRFVLDNAVMIRTLNRSFMRDPEERLYRDSVIVRFEDGKLNPKATFTALAAFLDIPYTESLTYCSIMGRHNAASMQGNVIGFDPAAIYRTYDEFANDDERCFIEYFMRDVYEYYGYDFHYYNGESMTLERVDELIDGFTTIDKYIRESQTTALREFVKEEREKIVREEHIEEKTEEEIKAYLDEYIENYINKKMERMNESRRAIAKMLLSGLHFINRRGQPLQMTPILQLDPALIEQTPYR